MKLIDHARPLIDDARPLIGRAIPLIHHANPLIDDRICFIDVSMRLNHDPMSGMRYPFPLMRSSLLLVDDLLPHHAHRLRLVEGLQRLLDAALRFIHAPLPLARRSLRLTEGSLPETDASLGLPRSSLRVVDLSPPMLDDPLQVFGRSPTFIRGPHALCRSVHRPSPGVQGLAPAATDVHGLPAKWRSPRTGTSRALAAGMKIAVCFALSASLLALSLSGARADEPSSSRSSADDTSSDGDVPATTPQRARTQWYGLQTLLVDGASLALAIGAVDTVGEDTSGKLLLASASGYALGAPFVHLLHGRPDVALADVALRVGAPIVLGVVGYGLGYAAGHDDPGCGGFLCETRTLDGVGGAILGAAGGFLAAAAVDAAVLGRERVAPAADPPDTAMRWTPRVGVSPRGGATVGVGGSF